MLAQLFLLDENSQVISECEDHRKLGYYSPYDGCRLHIVDVDPNSASAGGWLEDTSLVKKYEISEEAYNKRENTYRNFRKKKMEEDPNWSYKADMEARQGKEATEEHLKAFPQPASVNGVHTRAKVEDENYLEQEAASIKVGDRCQVSGGRRGEVMFVGRVAELPLGFWVGVKYDEPVGKNDGSVKGVRYFECLEKYGGFVRPDMCEVGDFPEEDPFADLDEM
jgi:tubulin-folding cofactor B